MIRGIVGQPNIFETAYTKSDHVPACTYFAGPLQLGIDGVECRLQIPKKLTSFEEGILKVAIQEIQVIKIFNFIFSLFMIYLAPPKKNTNICDSNKYTVSGISRYVESVTKF